MNKENFVDHVGSLFKLHGDETYGEGMSVLSHSVQAAEIAELAGLDQELVMSAFLHDIGHIYPLSADEDVESMDLFGMRHHEWIAKGFLGSYCLPERLIEPIALHVDAKRYLCTVDSEYYATLSDASKKTMEFQGGIMNESEKSGFESHSFFREAVEVRKIDDAAKLEDYHIDEEKLAYWLSRLQEYVTTLNASMV